MTVLVEPDPAYHAGHALVRVRGAAGASPGFHLRRPPGWEEGNLGPDGWQVADALLQPDAAEANGRDLVLRVGPRVCSHVEGGSYLFEMPSASVSEVVAWPDIPHVAHSSAVSLLRAKPSPAPLLPEPSPLDGDGSEEEKTVVVRKPPTAADTIVPRREQDVRPVPKRSRWPLLLGLLILVAAAGAGGWYAWRWLQPPDPGPTDQQADASPTPPSPPQPAPTPSPPDPAPPAPPAPPPEPPAPPPTPPAPPTPPPPLSLAGLPVPDVIARAPDAAAIRREGERRLGTEQKDDGLLLLEAAAARGDAAAMAALARMYDPIGFTRDGPLPAPDARQSAKYYRDAARAGDPAVAAGIAARREALRTMLEQRAQGGDLSATLTLRDFWP